ncbi:response regulator, partial [candidate division WOR-3 bacterium]|nr:response regulator [candidate division WOR-3 bacterium]
LTFSKGGMPVKTLCSIQELIKESALFSLRGAKSKCQFDLPNDLWTIEADRGQISEVINNLIINADQSMPEGGIIDIKANNISITPNDHIHLNSGNYVKISIEDHGIGINKEVIHNIYDPFFTTKQNGSGLGLTVVYSIISKHNGIISVESEVSNGTIFYIYLPACSKTINREKNTLEIVTGTGTILLMDDNKTIRNTTGKMLEQIGYNCDCASNGNELIDLYRNKMNTEGYYDAVLMDLTIPGGMGGKEAAKILLEIDPNAKLIVSSGYASDPIMANYKNYGFSDVIAKPYEIKELSNVIRDVLRK